MKKTLTLFLLFICFLGKGQNLVPNPSFENYVSLPCSWMVTTSDFNGAIQNWIMPTNGSSDIFSTLVNVDCFAHCMSTNQNAVGQQMPRTGNLMSAILTYGMGCGFLPDYREYLEIQLTTPLIVGESYYAEIYVSHADYSEHASNNIGLYFSDTLISDYTNCAVLNFTPQIIETNIITDKTNWVKISGNFVATSPAQYLTIGNFQENATTQVIFNEAQPSINARYFIDDITVRKACLSTISDTSICQGETIDLFANSDTLISWAEETFPSVIIGTDSILNVSPLVTTTYLAYSSCDTAAITVEVYGFPSINLGNDTTLCEGETFTLNAATSGATYLWQDNSTNSTFTLNQEGSYWVELTLNNCSVTDTIEIDAKKCEILFEMPNVFSPNADGINENYLPLNMVGIAEGQLMILNRWGQVLFESTTLSEGWNGQYMGEDCADGTYFWKVNYTDIKGEEVSLSGFFNLIR